MRSAEQGVVGPQMWWFTCGASAFHGLTIVLSSNGRYFPRWGMAGGTLLVIGAGVVLSQRAWRGRHGELVIMPVMASLCMAGALSAAKGEWLGAIGGALAAVGVVIALVRAWRSNRKSEAVASGDERVVGADPPDDDAQLQD